MLGKLHWSSFILCSYTKLYNFFSGSTHRWSVMLQYLKAESGTQSTLVVKKVSDTRWSARNDATKALSKGYRCLEEALKLISEDGNQKIDARYEAIIILKHLSKLETIFLADFWAVILERFNQVSQSLEQETLELDSAIKLLKSLLDFVMSAGSV